MGQIYNFHPRDYQPGFMHPIHDHLDQTQGELSHSGSIAKRLILMEILLDLLMADTQTCPLKLNSI